MGWNKRNIWRKSFEVDVNKQYLEENEERTSCQDCDDAYQLDEVRREKYSKQNREGFERWDEEEIRTYSTITMEHKYFPIHGELPIANA